MIIPENMRDQEASEFDGREGNSSGIESGGELNRPYKRVGGLVLSRLGEFQHRVPETRLD